MDPIGWFNENLGPDMLADVNAVEYESADGTIIPAYLTLPAGADARALPAIVLPHGGHLMVNAASRKRLLDEIESFLRDNNAAR